MQSPSVQPISPRRSGIGSVAITSLAMTTTALRTSGSRVAQAFSAMTTRSAVTEP